MAPATSRHTNLAGKFFQDTLFSGTYTMNANCNRMVTIDFGNGIPQHLSFVLVSRGDEIYVMDSDNGVIDYRTVKRQFPGLLEFLCENIAVQQGA
jgi:hypothetical protein